MYKYTHILKHYTTMDELKILGRIVIPAPIKRNTIVLCDDCKQPVNCSNGDPREKIITEYADGSKEIRWICPNCVYTQWTIFEEPEYNVFDGHWIDRK